MELNPSDLDIKMHPDPGERTGMTTLQMSAGVKIRHKPTGCEVACTLHRTPHKNREAASIALQLMLEDSQDPDA